jgi:hypothetical protein
MNDSHWMKENTKQEISFIDLMIHDTYRLLLLNTQTACSENKGHITIDKNKKEEKERNATGKRRG